MTPDLRRPAPRAASRDLDVPSLLAAHDTGLTVQRFLELIAADDAYAHPRPSVARALAAA